MLANCERRGGSQRKENRCGRGGSPLGKNQNESFEFFGSGHWIFRGLEIVKDSSYVLWRAIDTRATVYYDGDGNLAIIFPEEYEKTAEELAIVGEFLAHTFAAEKGLDRDLVLEIMVVPGNVSDPRDWKDGTMDGIEASWIVGHVKKPKK